MTGRFVSADQSGIQAGDPQQLDRYSYVHNNPLVFVDPTGLYAMFVCGMNQNCEGGGIGGFMEWVEQYWMIKYNFSREQAAHAWDALGQAFEEHMSMGLIMMAFDVAFFDTEGKYGPVWQGSNTINLVYDLNNTIGGLDSIAWRGGMDTLIGYSFGGVVAHDYVWGIVHGKIGNTSGNFDLVLLQPGFHVRGEADAWEKRRDRNRWKDWGHPTWAGTPWPHPYLSQADWAGTIITVNETWLDKMVYGTVEGATNLTSNECSGGFVGGALQHCTMPDKASEVLNRLMCPTGCMWPGP
jgi:hypothetical protein